MLVAYSGTSRIGWNCEMGSGGVWETLTVGGSRKSKTTASHQAETLAQQVRLLSVAMIFGVT